MAEGCPGFGKGHDVRFDLAGIWKFGALDLNGMERHPGANKKVYFMTFPVTYTECNET